MKAYDTFGNAMDEKALKVIITNEILLEEVMQVGKKKAVPVPVAK
jgi:hypothetical protein